MRVSTIIFGVLVSAAVVLAQERGPLLTALQPRPEGGQGVVLVDNDINGRSKRSLLLGAGAATLGAGILGAGALGAGLFGAGLLGAKAGFVGGALASGGLSHGRSYGGYGGYYGGGYGGGYGGYGGYSGYGGYGGYGGVYRSYYPSSYVYESWY